MHQQNIMAQIDYKKAFSKLSHIKALSHDQKFDEIVQNLIVHALNQLAECNPRNEVEVTKRITEIYGISIRTPIILSNLDKLQRKNEITKDQNSKQYFVTQLISNKLKNRIDEANKLEKDVKENWFSELRLLQPEITIENLNDLWTSLSEYFCRVFEIHGIQTLQILNPNTKINTEDQKGLGGIIDEILKNQSQRISKEILIESINHFIANADELRTIYISQLADSTFTSFALTSDAETVSFLNQRYNDLLLLLDTNFIFGILDLHKNSEDASAREILEEVKKNRLPFKLGYHPETLSEFRRAFDIRAMQVRASKWTRETSRVALSVDGLSPLETLFHQQNVEDEIDPGVFLDKYDHVDLLLKDLGLIEIIPRRITNDNEYVEIEGDIEKYQQFYDSIPNRKPKSYSSFKHDVVVLREVRSLNTKKTKFLESHAFFISSDFVLAKFEKVHYKRSWEINYVVSPSVFLQLIRPFIENDYSSNKRFIDTFSIPEFRSFDIDYSTTRSKALQILNDNYHNTSFETKVKILRDQVLLDKLEKANQNFDNQLEIIENQIAVENSILIKQKSEAEENIKQIIKEKEVAINEVESKTEELNSKVNEIDVIKSSHVTQILQEQIEYKNNLCEILSKSIAASEKRQIPILEIIDGKVKRHTFYLLIIPVLFFALIFFLIYKLSWNTMEPFTYILSIVSALVGYIYLAVKGESINPSKYFEHYKKGIISKIYNDFQFDSSELELQKGTITNLQKEISALKIELKSKASSD